MSSPRIRDVLPKLRIGVWPTGPKNSITDVDGVLVHTQSIRLPATETHGPANTGVTTILPSRDFYNESCYAGVHPFNGRGELTGSHWIHETGLLNSPIILTGTYGVGTAYHAVHQYISKEYPAAKDRALLPVVGETWDGFLGDVTRFAVTPEHVVYGIQNASSDAVPEGNTGGGTGMVCHSFKGGTGSSSRIVSGVELVDESQREFTVGVLVQANHGERSALRVGGVPVGWLFMHEQDPATPPSQQEADPSKGKEDGSIIIVVATDAPLHPLQLQRLAQRATVGLSRVGGLGHNSSGDIFIAFSTANREMLRGAGQWGRGGAKPAAFTPRVLHVDTLDENTINPLFAAVADATEEAIYNALCGAETMVGREGRRVEALPADRLRRLMEKYLE